ncbi:putative leader peptide [Jatrophihabitans sp.]|uniref:putative leader peptide n=1 Tax=Jatrophihabitans sp. TaxID=1932789 RepID=UPI0038CD2874
MGQHRARRVHAHHLPPGHRLRLRLRQQLHLHRNLEHQPLTGRPQPGPARHPAVKPGRVSSATLFQRHRVWNHGRVRRDLLLTSRRHIDLLRVAGATC